MSDFNTEYKNLLSTFNLVNQPVIISKDEDGLNGDSSMENPCPNATDCKIQPGDGIIFTDSQSLAEKFSVSSIEVLSVINGYISVAKERGFEWRLLDMAEPVWQRFLSIDKSPYSYHKALDAFVSASSWHTDADTCLFIIGGNDVIPVKQSVDSLNYKDYLTDEDIFYGFPLSLDIAEVFSSILSEDSTPEQISAYLINNATFNVARLPVDARKINADFGATIGNYFQRVNESFGIIPISSILFVTALQWTKESDFVAQGLPLVNIPDKPGIIKNGVFQSPDVDLSIGESLSEYYSALNESEMLLFNLHGAPDYNVSAYFGDNANPRKHYQPRAFDIECLDYFNGCVINSMACFGAKYLNSGSSILLSSIYRNVLLFVGSSNFAWGQQGSEFPCGCSETLLKLYTGNLLTGMPAGKALLQAKCDYYSHFVPIDGKEKSSFTVREFNLFGDPSLSCQCIADYKTVSLPDYTSSLLSASKGAIHNAYGITALSVLDEAYENVREAVDNNLRELSIRLEHLLRNDLGYNDVKLSSIEKITPSTMLKNYRFTYSFEQPYFRGCVEIITDINGKPASIFYTK